MKKLLPLAIGFCIALSSCYVLGPSRGRRQHKSKRACHPSEYWDGHKCRHKGKAKGHKKHRKKHKDKHKHKKHKKHKDHHKEHRH